MKTPSATYRVQLSADFTLHQLRQIIPYLDEMGVNCVYASPIFVARKGSTHGYDVVNPLDINPEIGSLQELKEISRELKKRDMLWLQDIVPNHMAFDSSNPWIADILERGAASDYYSYFDINWEQYNDSRRGKLMIPTLGAELSEAIKKSEVQLQLDKGFFFSYYEHRFPASQFTYLFVLPFVISRLGEADAGNLEDLLREVPDTVEDSNSWKKAKDEVSRAFRENQHLATALEEALHKINNTPHLLEEVLEQQHFFLAHWQTTESEINYRRFFTINDLICLRMGDQQVFDSYHQLIAQLCEEEVFDGLRVDHIDGLFDPEQYLHRLRNLVGNKVYLVIEKILEWDEQVPLKWPIEGTSGYGFLAASSRVFTDPGGEAAFEKEYQNIAPDLPPYHDLVYNKKQFIIFERMGGELVNLLNLLKQLDLWPEGTGEEVMRNALAAFLSAFPVYRIYPQDFPLSERGYKRVKEAYELARQKLPHQLKELEHLNKIFSGKADDQESAFYFLQRCQQFTGPLAAKGVEDTTFYLYNRHISRNEVGDSPEDFGIDLQAFHQRMGRRQKNFPNALNTTATHDTKRGEDARLRINCLSEIPEQWFQKLSEWREINKGFVKKGPSANEEYFIYQALLGAWPAAGGVDGSFLQRTKNYLQKTLREAKQHSSWSQPDEAYESSVFSFLEQILQHEAFRKSFESFAENLSFCGMIYSLGQSLLKITAPGLPDVYQGTELWDLSYVDPDNRRPVDYPLRQKQLEDFAEVDLNRLKKEWQQAQIKQFILHKALKERRNNQEIFRQGAYKPVEASEAVLGFIRENSTGQYLILMPRKVVAKTRDLKWPIDSFWGDQEVKLPAYDGSNKWQNIFTGEQLEPKNNVLKISACFSELPVAMLKRSEI